MDKYSEVYPYDGISSKGMRSEVLTYFSMDEQHWKHYAKCKKPEIKDHILYDSIYIKHPEEAKLYDGICCCQGLGWGK